MTSYLIILKANLMFIRNWFCYKLPLFCSRANCCKDFEVLSHPLNLVNVLLNQSYNSFRLASIEY